MRLAAILLLGLFPFIAAGLLAWIGPKRTWAAHYRHARERTAALAEAATRERARLAEAEARLEASQQRLRGEDG